MNQKAATQATLLALVVLGVVSFIQGLLSAVLVAAFVWVCVYALDRRRRE